ncbi:hypothetical protein lerEdw1_020710 [Lerista edwardsae]|nr:hypothetical protein lerEdw1_020710 [Lerista edwardsae]
MSYYNNCYAQCPASTVTIQPPPFVLTIPGPEFYCPSQAFGIEQYNPCAYYGGGLGGSRYPSLVSTDFSSYSLPSLSSRSFSTSSYRTY